MLSDYLQSFKQKFGPNIKAGVTVSLIAIPLSISLAVASGGTPLQGLLTAIWACAIAGFVGGSNYNIFGPAGALTALLMSFYLATNDSFSLPILAIVVGIWSLIIRGLKLTKYITLIPSTALHGFIAGVSLTIGFGQLNNALGLTDLPKHESTLANIAETFSHLSQTNIASIILFAAVLGFLLVWKKLVKNIPAPIPAAVIGIIIGYFVTNGTIPGEIATLSSKFPELSFKLIDLQWMTSFKTMWDNFNVGIAQNLVISGFTIALVSILETIISGKIADKLTNTKFDQQKEVLGVAAANIVGGFSGGLPTTAVLIRTALNVKSGATSWISAVICGLSVLVISWLGFSYFVLIPMPVIAAILVNIAIGLLDFNHYKHVYDFDHYDAAILALVAAITFAFDPIYGILAGVSISLLQHLKHTTDGQIYVTLFRNNEFVKKMTGDQYLAMQQAGDTIVVKLQGDISFLSSNAIVDFISKLPERPTVVFSMSSVGHIDLDGVDALKEIIYSLEQSGCNYYISGLAGSLKTQLEHESFFKHIEEEGRYHYASADVIKMVTGR